MNIGQGDRRGRMKKYGIWLGFFLLLVYIISQSMATAIGNDEKINREEIFQTIRKGYEAQYSIRDQHYSVEKMYDILSPYITDNFLQVFTDENHSRSKTSGAHLLTKVPPFTFTSSTSITFDKEHQLVYIYERNKSQSPVYQIVVMQKEKGIWKMASYTENEMLPSDIRRFGQE